MKIAYDKETFKQFHKRGREHGDAGFLLVEQTHNMNMYEGYGTIERPNKSLHYITMMRNPIWESREASLPEERAISSFSFELIDFSKKQE